MSGPSRNDSVTVGTTSVEVAATRQGKSGARKVIHLTNNSTAGQTITVVFSDSEVAVAGIGIVLKPGSTVTDSISQGYVPWQGKISGIADAASGSLAVYEQVG